ncbi:MAG: T9SS type A sorting domain-containing protein [Ignavibacteriota bacterium]
MKLPRNLRIVLFMMLISLASQNAFAQWSFIKQFNERLQVIYFTDSVDGHIGFTSTYTGIVWRSQDNGSTWSRVGQWDNACHSISFKDSLIGWGGNGSTSFKTTDGGVSWFSLSSTLPFSPYSIHYNKQMQLLFMSSGIKSVCISNDEGATWNTFKSPSTIATLGIAFSNGLNGIISTVSSPPSDYIVTNDGGLTWFPIPNQLESYQPFGFPNTKIFYLVNEGNLNGNSSSIYRSIDGGLNWKQIFAYHNGIDTYSLTGTMQMGPGGYLYIQTRRLGTEGIMFSSDSGFVWNSICGPRNFPDTKFYADNNSVFAADSLGNLWVNKTGIGSNSTPQLSSANITSASLFECQKFDTTIRMTFFDSCNGIQAKLVSASITGSNNFYFSSPSAIPRTIHPDDSLIVSYNPVSQARDTAALHLKFHLGWKDFDTTIQLFGSGRIPKANVKFIPTLSKNKAAAGSAIDLFVMPDKLISGRRLDSISFSVIYKSDLLDASGNTFTTGIPGALISVGAEKPSPSVPLPEYREREVVVRGNDLSLDPSVPVLDLQFKAMLTTTTSTPIRIANLRLNGGDADYQNCILSAASSDTVFNLLFLCGDTIIYDFMRTGKVLSIISIRPNPVKDELEIDLHSSEKQDARVEIFDALGTRVFSGMQNIIEGKNQIHLDTKVLSGGMYVVRIGEASQSFVKTK